MGAAYTKEIVCLANSTKPNGRCIAGREVSGGQLGAWIRPVSTPEQGESIRPNDSKYHHDGGGQPALLDVMRIVFKEHRPLHHQHENHLIDPGYSWGLAGKLAWKDALAMVETVPSLWGSGEQSFHGVNDEVSVASAAKIQTSLVLLRPKKLTLICKDWSKYTGGSERRPRASFQVGGTAYRLVVTDPLVEEAYKDSPDTEDDISGALICASLTDFFGQKNCAYKLVAAIIKEP